MVLLAVWLYSTHDRSLHRPPPIHIASFEKPAIDRAFTPGSTPRSTDAKRLNMDPFDIKGLAMTSSRPSSPGPMPRQLSRGNMPKGG